MRDSDSNLVNLLNDNCEKAFASIYDKYWDKLYYLAYQKVRSQHIAEEIVQEVFLTLWKKRGKLKLLLKGKNFTLFGVRPANQVKEIRAYPLIQLAMTEKQNHYLLLIF